MENMDKELTALYQSGLKYGRLKHNVNESKTYGNAVICET